MPDWTWIRSDDDSDLSGGGLIDKALEVESGGTGERVVTVPFNDAGSAVWFSPSNQPANATWRADETATAKLRVITGNSNVSITAVSLVRVNSAGVFQEVYGTGVGGLPVVASAGVKTFSITTLVQTGASVSDRLRVGFTLTHDGSLGSTDVGLGFGDADSDTIDAPIERKLARYAGAVASLGMRAATIADLNGLSAVPASIAMTGAPASLGMSATAASLDLNKAGAS